MTSTKTHFCDLFLLELRLSGDLEVLNEVQNYSFRLLEIAKSQHSFSLLAETYVLQSKLSLLNLDIPKAQNLIIQAYILAEEKSLQNLALKIAEEQNTLNAQIHKWEEFIKRKASVGEIIEFSQIEDYIENIVRTKLLQKDIDVLQYAQTVRDKMG